MSLMKFKGKRWPPRQWITATYRDSGIKWYIKPPKIGFAESSSTIGMIARIQNHVNMSIIYQRDEPGKDIWGTFRIGKIWGLDGGVKEAKFGDCDDYALEKYRNLIESGYGGCSRVVVCTREGKPHLVICVDLGDNTYVMCNTLDGVWIWDDFIFKKYKFLYSSVPGQFMWSYI